MTLLQRIKDCISGHRRDLELMREQRDKALADLKKSDAGQLAMRKEHERDIKAMRKALADAEAERDAAVKARDAIVKEMNEVTVYLDKLARD